MTTFNTELSRNSYTDAYQFQQDFINIFACMRESTEKVDDPFLSETVSKLESKIVQDTFEGIEFAEESEEPVAIKCEVFKESNKYVPPRRRFYNDNGPPEQDNWLRRDRGGGGYRSNNQGNYRR